MPTENINLNTRSAESRLQVTPNSKDHTVTVIFVHISTGHFHVLVFLYHRSKLWFVRQRSGEKASNNKRLWSRPTVPAVSWDIVVVTWLSVNNI